MLDLLFKKLEDFYPEQVKIRRDLHMYPELSFKEEKTPIKVAEFLTGLGLDVRTGVGGRGVVGVLQGGKPGKTVALRADFDALPIQDEKDVAYKSRVPGVMHACGHDVHTAALLGVSKVLSEVKQEIAGTIVFIHQFAEELPPGGAAPMIEDGCLDGVDVIFGAHVSSGFPLGTIGVKDDYFMAAMDKFMIEVQGKGGHGAYPHTTVDSLIVGCQLALNLQQIVSRRVNPLQPAVVTVGQINSGNAFNVIPNTAQLTGTVRTFEENTRDFIEQSIDQITKATCEGAGATYTYDYQKGYPAVRNHAGETARVERVAQELFGPDQVRRIQAMMGGEDFAYYLQKVPGTFFYVGGSNPDIGATYPHHHPKFDIDERSMTITGKLFIASVLDYLC